MFLEERLFGPDDRTFTWAVLAGIAWLIVALCTAILGLGIFVTVWYADRGLAIWVFVCFPAAFFARRLLFGPSCRSSVAAAAYGLAAVLGLCVLMIAGGSSVAYLLAAAIPAILSAGAAWEIRRATPGFGSRAKSPG
jgi:hypothetical protein